MTGAAGKQNEIWPPERVGIAIGCAYGFAIFVLIAFRSQGFYLLIIFTAGIFALAAIAALSALGGAIGLALAKGNCVPALRPIPMLAIVLGVALGPTTAGFVEITLREPAVELPPDAHDIQWQRWPWGERVMKFESQMAVLDLHNHMVQSANENGWVCRYCQFQPSTGTGHAGFLPGGNGRGRMGFEVWPGEKAQYGMRPSKMTQARVFSARPTLSVEWTLFAISVLLAAGMFRFSRRRSAA